MDKKIITLEQLAEMYSISRTTIDRWRREGMPFQKVGRGVRFDLQEVENWIKDNKSNTK